MSKDRKAKHSKGVRIDFHRLPYCDRCGIRQQVHGTVGARETATGVELVGFDECCAFCRADLTARGWLLNDLGDVDGKHCP